MTDILSHIIEAKQKALVEQKKEVQISDLEKQPLFKAERPDFYSFLKEKSPALICEFKRKSPSKGILNARADVLSTVTAYQDAGASAVSILTDPHFDGRSSDILAATPGLSIPALRKDFIIDEFQIVESKALGASAILLIAAVLSKEKIGIFANLAWNLGLEVLLELHDPVELDKVPEGIRVVGINNRNLKTFVVDLENSIQLAARLPEDTVKVSESGIDSVETLLMLHSKGFQGFLIGETFMKQAIPGEAAATFFSELNTTIRNHEN